MLANSILGESPRWLSSHYVFPGQREKALAFSSFSYKDTSSVQFSSVTQSCPTLCHPMNRSMPGLPVHHHLPEFTQTPITSWQIDGETMETVRDFIFLGSKTTADGDCSHEIKRHLLLEGKSMTNLLLLLLLLLLTHFSRV